VTGGAQVQDHASPRPIKLRERPTKAWSSVAYAFIFESDVVDIDGYDQLMKGIGRESLDAPSPEGYIAHVSGPRAQGGWRVVDVWESEQAANAFYSSPTFTDVVTGSGVPIDVAPWPVHRLEIDRTLRQIDRKRPLLGVAGWRSRAASAP